MSQNPFNAPAPSSKPVNQPSSQAFVPRPGLLTFVLVACIILAIASTLCSLAAGGMTVFQEQFLEFNDSFQKPTEDMLAARQELMDIQKPYMIPGIILLLSSLVVGGLLFISSISAFKQNASARRMLSWVLILSAVNLLLNLGLSLVAQLMNFSEMIALQKRMAGPQGAQMGDAFFETSAYAGVGMVVVFYGGVLLFYVLSFFYINKQDIKAWYGG